MDNTPYGPEDLNTAIAKIIKADKEVVQQLDDGLVKKEIMSLRGEA
jgi:hypothetical protein